MSILKNDTATLYSPRLICAITFCTLILLLTIKANTQKSQLHTTDALPSFEASIPSLSHSAPSLEFSINEETGEWESLVDRGLVGFIPIKSSSTWFNLATGEAEYFHGLPPAERIPEFIPQNPAAQGLYDLYLEMGNSPEESMEKVQSQESAQ